MSLYVDGVCYSRSVHTLVAEAFIGPRPEGLQINHKDANKLNNQPTNLEYVTPQQNRHHIMSLTGTGIGEKHGKARLTEADVRQIRRLSSEGHSRRKLAAQFGVDRVNIKLIALRRTWKHVI